MVYKDLEKRRKRDRVAYRNSPDLRAKKLSDRYRNRLKKLGLSLEDYQEMLVKQDYKCKICKREDSGRKGSPKFCVDHCHRTGKIRGLLCFYCNQGLGAFKDNSKFLKEAIVYLEA